MDFLVGVNMGILSLIFLSAMVGCFKPFIPGVKKWHFALAAIVTFFVVGATAPTDGGGRGVAQVPPPPLRGAIASTNDRGRSAIADTPAENIGISANVDAAADDPGGSSVVTSKNSHALILGKAADALSKFGKYDRANYPKLFKLVGAKKFADLDVLERGAVLAVSESRYCDGVSSFAVSDQSSRNNAIWFVDCRNQVRFMVDEAKAKAALEKEVQGTLAFSDQQPSCSHFDLRACDAAR